MRLPPIMPDLIGQRFVMGQAVSHYTPVKHGFCVSPASCLYSSFHRFVDAGIDSRDWGTPPGADLPAVGTPKTRRMD